MTMRMNATEVKAKLFALLDVVEQGDVIEITRNGRTVARLTPARGPHALMGRFANVAITTSSEAELYTTGAAWDSR